LIDRDNRTFICSVVYYDIADYSTKSVEVQIRLKEKLNRFTTEAIKNVAVNDRIILDTGDGAAICFLGDPEDALFVAMSLRDAVLNAAGRFTNDPLLVRFGINLGPVKLVNDINNQKNIIGDGINVGQRIMSFAEPGQILVSRSYFEVVSCLTQEYATLFHYLGMRADKHIRKHEIYSIIKSSEEVKAIYPTASHRNAIPFDETQNPPPGSAFTLGRGSKSDIRISSSAPLNPPQRLRKKLYACGGIAVAIILAVILYYLPHQNFGGREIQPDKPALSPETPLNGPDKPLPENTPSTEIVSPEQTEPAISTTPDPALILPQESPVESLPENTPSTENVRTEQTVQPGTKPPVPDAIIQFAITPWGEVYVDGKNQGASPPLTSLSIAPGKHVVEITNTAFPPFSQTFEINSNEILKFNHKFK
jgi:hypothetical protein